MQLFIRQAHKFLIEKQKTIAVAESCTGGLLAYFLTQLPGSSRYFQLGVVAYSNAAKHRLLHIPPGLIIKHTAVSKTVAAHMAESVRKLASSDFGIGITGIAGPAGGTAAKPIGTVFIAVADKKKTISKKFIFKGSRGRIRMQSALKALELLLHENIYRT